MTDDRADRIRHRAYQIWESEGQPHGRDQDHWQQAERDLANAGAETPFAEGAPDDATPPQDAGANATTSEDADALLADDAGAAAPASAAGVTGVAEQHSPDAPAAAPAAKTKPKTTRRKTR